MISKRYVKSYFLLEIISVFPGLVTLELFRYVYWTKLIRLFLAEKYFDLSRNLIEK